MTSRLPLAVALLVLADALPMVAQRPTFSARTEMVRVDVLVTERGRPATGLRAADFQGSTDGNVGTVG